MRVGERPRPPLGAPLNEQDGDQARVSAIVAEQLTKRFRRVRNYWDLARYPWRQSSDLAVDEVDLEVRPRELFGILGENGAGKTTLIRMLSTTLLPTSGSATVGGYDVLADPLAVRRIIGLVSGDERSFYWRLTGRQNLTYFAALNHVPSRDTPGRIKSLIDTLDLGQYADRRFASYSTGIRQRFAIARGLLTEPQILFLDEPTRALDPIAADEVRRYVAEHIVGELGCTVLLATHTLTEADALCDRIAIMRSGRIVETGTTAELRERMHMATFLEIAVRGGHDGLLDSLRAVDGVVDVTAGDGDAPRHFSLRLRDGGDVMTRALRTVLDTGAHVEACTTREPTLDDIYRAAHA